MSTARPAYRRPGGEICEKTWKGAASRAVTNERLPSQGCASGHEIYFAASVCSGVDTHLFAIWCTAYGVHPSVAVQGLAGRLLVTVQFLERVLRRIMCRAWVLRTARLWDGRSKARKAGKDFKLHQHLCCEFECQTEHTTHTR